MQYLNDASFRILSLGNIVECIREQRTFPEKALAITFDDGFRNFYQVAFPVLKKLRFTATVFLVTGHCGKSNDWERDHKEIPRLDLLSWEEIIEMSNEGSEFGSHGMTHRSFLKLNKEQVRKEIMDSKSTLQERLGKSNFLFAYPYGRQTKETREMIAKEFEGACSTELGFVSLDSDLFSLPRIDMYYFSKNDFFSALETPAFPFYIRIRNLLRSLKNAGADYTSKK